MTPQEALARINALHANLVGARNREMRKDREALALIAALVPRMAANISDLMWADMGSEAHLEAANIHNLFNPPAQP